MLSISPPMKGAGKGDYYTGLAQEDYYLKGGEPLGEWYGEGAEQLGLNGKVKDIELRMALEGFSPSGEKLVQNAGDKDRQSGWDLTFSAPKSVSTLWAVSDPETKKAIQEAHHKAVHSALDYIQDEAGFTRRGSGGVDVERAQLTFATFEHGTSRAQDPQIHTHALLMNTGVREDGTTGTVLSQPVFEQKMAAGAIYRVELAHQLEKELNLRVQREKSWFTVEGSPKDLEAEFSKRRKEIDGALKEGGYSGAVASKIAALNTREAKEHLPRDVLFAEWQKVGNEFGFGADQVKELTGKEQRQRNSEKELSETFERAATKISNKESYFSRSSYVRHAAEEAQGRGVSAIEVRAGADSYLNNSEQIVHLGSKNGKEFFATKEIIELERNIIETTRNRAVERNLVSEAAFQSAIDARPKLRPEQIEAVKRITQSEGATQIVTGFAGTGKSYMLEAAKEAFEKDGFRVVGAAPSGVAAQNLQDGSGIRSNTIHRTFSDLDSGELVLDKKSVLVVDEAGMVSTKLMSKLVDETSRSGAKLILVGDERQIQSVQAGGALKTLKGEIGFSELTEIRRQSQDWAKEAVKSFAQGKADEALKAYNDKGFVTVAKDPEQTREALISNWKREGITNPADNIIIASTNLDVSILNEKAQAVRYSEGKLSGDGLTENGKTYFEGDRILMTKNSERFGVKNGNLGTIKEIDSNSKTIRAELDSGKIVQLNLKAYKEVSLGYAITAHKSQGGTFENAYLHVSSQDQKEIAYVKASRVKGNAHFYMDKDTAGENLSVVSKIMKKSQMKELATSASRNMTPVQQRGERT